MTHLLVTNDFPPKVGGIQSYLYELWARLDPSRFAVLTHADADAANFDAAQSFPIHRTKSKFLLPTPGLRAQIDRLSASMDASLVVLDPALPLGAVGRSLRLPYVLVLHGAEVTVPARLPVTSSLLRRTIEESALIIAAGGYPLAEAKRIAKRMPPVQLVPPGVDSARFRPRDAEQRRAARRRFSLPEEGPLVLSVSRLVPRKGMDVLIEASARLAKSRPDLTVAIGGTGRDHKRLERLIERTKAPVRLLGYIADADLPDLTAAADVWTMLCRDRWLGLEQEGFGIVFLEAAAAGVACVAGRSGGAAEAVLDGRTGLVVDRPGDVVAVERGLARLLDDEVLRERLAAAGRERAQHDFDYDLLSRSLGEALARHGG